MSLQPLPTHPSSSFPTSLLFSGQSFTVQCTDGKGEEDTDSRNSHLLNHLIQFLRQFSSVHLCPTLCDPMDCSTPGLPVHHQLPESTQIHVHGVSDAIQPSHPCHPLLLLPAIIPSIRVFSNKSVLRVRWPKYWSFRYSVSPSNEYSGLISFRMDWFELTIQYFMSH